MNDLMTRRAAIARVAYLLGGVVSASTVAGVLAGCDRNAAPEAATSALGADRKELVATIGEHILPETDTPGARAARVQDFIDVMMTDYYPAEERDRFIAGLDRLDARAQRVFGVRFLDATPEQQLQLVEAYNRHAFSDPGQQQSERGAGTDANDAQGVPPTSGTAELDSDWDPEDVGRQSFFRRLKELVLIGYYTSEVGATQELHMNPLGAWIADTPYSEIGRAWA